MALKFRGVSMRAIAARRAIRSVAPLAIPRLRMTPMADELDRADNADNSPNPSTPIDGVSDGPDNGIRCFLALELSPEVRAKLADLLSRLQKGAVFTGAHPTWVKPENIHLTLHFLGKIEPEAIEAMKPRLDAVAARHDPPSFDVRMLGCFPNEKMPKVLWIGLSKPDRSLFNLHEALMPVISKAGAKVDTRPFHPHLTLGRIKSMRGLRGLMDLIGSHRRFEAGACRPTELILFRSDLHPDGAIYTPLHRSPLKSA